MAEQMAEMQWLKPKLVAQIRFVKWTADDHLRHAAFLGLRTDKKPGMCGANDGGAFPTSWIA
jgi:ATP-dependent DNA ligase